MQWISTPEGILGIEGIVFTLIMILLIFRPTSPKTMAKEVDSLTHFLDKVDKESLIKLSELDQRDSTRQDTIHCNLKAIDDVLKECKTKQSCDDLHHVSDEYIKIIKAVDAIRLREIEQLKAHNKQLKRKKVFKDE